MTVFETVTVVNTSLVQMGSCVCEHKSGVYLHSSNISVHLGLRDNRFWLIQPDLALIRRCSYQKILYPWKINKLFGVSLKKNLLLKSITGQENKMQWLNSDTEWPGEKWHPGFLFNKIINPHSVEKKSYMCSVTWFVKWLTYLGKSNMTMR